MRKVLTYLLSSLILAGMLVFIFNMLLSFRNVQLDRELPLTDIQGIQEINEKIYVGLGAYNRIQVYDLEGKYLKYIPINNFAKAYDFVVNDEENVSIHVIYSRRSSPKTFKQYNGDRYEKVSHFPLKINKIDQKEERLVIQQALLMSFWGGTFTPWLIAAICCVLFMLINSVIIFEVFGLNLSKNEKLKVCLRRIF